MLLYFRASFTVMAFFFLWNLTVSHIYCNNKPRIQKIIPVIFHCQICAWGGTMRPGTFIVTPTDLQDLFQIYRKYPFVNTARIATLWSQIQYAVAVTLWLLLGLQTSQTYQYCKASVLLWNRVAHLRGMSNNIYETQLLTYLHWKCILSL